MSAVRVGSLCCAGWLSVFLEVMQQRLPGFAEVESPKSRKFLGMFPVTEQYIIMIKIKCKWAVALWQ